MIAEAKSQSYKLKKAEVGPGHQYLMQYHGAYFKIGLIDATFGIIDNGEPATVYHNKGPRNKLTIVNDIGICVIMPVYIDGDPREDGKVVVE